MSSSQDGKFPTMNPDEIEKFKNLSSAVWNKEIRLSALHPLNHLRVPWIVDGIIEAGLVSKDKIGSEKPLEGLRVLDVGCGGNRRIKLLTFLFLLLNLVISAGILTEALAKYGCTVVGLDPCVDMIHEARKHMALNPSLTNITYLSETVEQHAEKHLEEYDAIVASMVIEHVDQPDLFLDMCSRCLKPGAPIYINTFNKTWTCWFFLIMFRFMMGHRHHHDHHEGSPWYKFISPGDVQKSLDKCK